MGIIPENNYFGEEEFLNNIPRIGKAVCYSASSQLYVLSKEVIYKKI